MLQHPKIDEMNEPPIVGQVYLVPAYMPSSWLVTVLRGMPAKYLTCLDDSGWIPVLGPLHDDNLPGMKFDDGHNAHVDHRFVDLQGDAIVALQVIPNSFQYRPFTCLRNSFDPDRPDHTDLGARIAFQDLCEKKTLDACKRCPHQGTHMGSIAPDKDGNVFCPAHGLRFHKESGIIQPLVVNGKVFNVAKRKT